jgi:hemerythrin
MNIVWDDSFSTGIAEIDGQHKEFIKLIQRIEILHKKNSSQDFIRRILQELTKYAEYHFVSEENLMLLLKYPSIKAHQVEHQQLLRSVKYRVEAFENGLETLEAVIDFLITWFTSHTVQEDRKIGEYLSAQAASAES